MFRVSEDKYQHPLQTMSPKNCGMTLTDWLIFCLFFLSIVFHVICKATCCVISVWQLHHHRMHPKHTNRENLCLYIIQICLICSPAISETADPSANPAYEVTSCGLPRDDWNYSPALLYTLEESGGRFLGFVCFFLQGGEGYCYWLGRVFPQITICSILGVL